MKNCRSPHNILFPRGQPFLYWTDGLRVMYLTPVRDWTELKLDRGLGKLLCLSPGDQESQMRACGIHQDLISRWLLNSNSSLPSISRQRVCIFEAFCLAFLSHTLCSFGNSQLSFGEKWLCNKLTSLPLSSTGILAHQVPSPHKYQRACCFPSSQ